jgi:peptide/nickel transport system substrate-binding protein
VVNYLKTVGIRTRMRPLERAAFFAQVRDRKPRNLLQAANGAYGNAATRIEREMTSGGFSYGSYPEIDDLFHQ